MVILLALFSCDKDKGIGPQTDFPIEDTLPTKVDSSDRVLWILNEGNYNWNNATLSIFNSTQNTINNNVFEQVNNKLLGDVAQSMLHYKNSVYIVMNNSGKVEVLNDTTYASVATISGFVSPRYLCLIPNGYAFLSDLYANEISVLNLGSNSIYTSIKTNGWIEKMCYFNGYVYAAGVNSGYLYQINSNSFTIDDSLYIGTQPSDVELDTNGNIWVLCLGSGTTTSSLVKVNITSFEVELSLSFPNTSDYAHSLVMNGDKTKLYFIYKDIFEMSIYDTNLASDYVISGCGVNYYTLYIDPKSNDIYVTDAIDYVQEGIVYKYDENGKLLTKFKTGIIPGAMLFVD